MQAVKSIMPSKCEEARNKDGKTPCKLFTKPQDELMKAGEKRARDISTSFTLVGTLIITIMFATAFTVPGGNDQNTGMPIFLRKLEFTIFIIADAISLITSFSSVLIFIGSSHHVMLRIISSGGCHASYSLASSPFSFQWRP